MSLAGDCILKAREARSRDITRAASHTGVVVLVKANTPGTNKQTNIAYYLVRYFTPLFLRRVPGHATFFDGCDGPYFLITPENTSSETAKKVAKTIEETSALGRLIDIDVYQDGRVLHRTTGRSCLLCAQNAFDCIRSGKHSLEAVKAAIVQKAHPHVLSTMHTLIEQAILDELDLDPKFGLVTPTSSGTHQDMDYALMRSAKAAILPGMMEMFMAGFSAKSTEGLFSESRSIGLKTEKAMYEATNGVNAYKGLIFNLGLILTASGYVLANGRGYQDICPMVQYLVGLLSRELETVRDTYGAIAYHKHQISGARGEAESGYKTARSALLFLKDFSWKSRIRTLIYLISHSHDTTLLKRSGSMEAYLEHQAVFARVDKVTPKVVRELTEYSIAHRLSFGGSADLLVACCFLKRFKMQFFPEENHG